jgi:hypothetical protein
MVLRNRCMFGVACDIEKDAIAPGSLWTIVISRKPGRACFHISSCSSLGSLGNFSNVTKGAGTMVVVVVEVESLASEASVAELFDAIVLVAVAQYGSTLRECGGGSQEVCFLNF